MPSTAKQQRNKSRSSPKRNDSRNKKKEKEVRELWFNPHATKMGESQGTMKHCDCECQVLRNENVQRELRKLSKIYSQTDTTAAQADEEKPKKTGFYCFKKSGSAKRARSKQRADKENISRRKSKERDASRKEHEKKNRARSTSAVRRFKTREEAKRYRELKTIYTTKPRNNQAAAPKEKEPTSCFKRKKDKTKDGAGKAQLDNSSEESVYSIEEATAHKSRKSEPRSTAAKSKSTPRASRARSQSSASRQRARSRSRADKNNKNQAKKSYVGCCGTRKKTHDDKDEEDFEAYKLAQSAPAHTKRQQTAAPPECPLTSEEIELLEKLKETYTTEPKAKAARRPPPPPPAEENTGCCGAKSKKKQRRPADETYAPRKTKSAEVNVRRKRKPKTGRSKSDSSFYATGGRRKYTKLTKLRVCFFIPCTGRRAKHVKRIKQINKKCKKEKEKAEESTSKKQQMPSVRYKETQNREAIKLKPPKVKVKQAQNIRKAKAKEEVQEKIQKQVDASKKKIEKPQKSTAQPPKKSLKNESQKKVEKKVSDNAFTTKPNEKKVVAQKQKPIQPAVEEKFEKDSSQVSCCSFNKKEKPKQLEAAEETSTKPKDDEKLSKKSTKPKDDEKLSKKSTKPKGDEKLSKKSTKPKDDEKLSKKSTIPKDDEKLSKKSTKPKDDEELSKKSTKPKDDEKLSKKSTIPKDDEKLSKKSMKPKDDEKLSKKSTKPKDDENLSKKSTKPKDDEKLSKKSSKSSCCSELRESIQRRVDAWKQRPVQKRIEVQKEASATSCCSNFKTVLTQKLDNCQKRFLKMLRSAKKDGAKQKQIKKSKRVKQQPAQANCCANIKADLQKKLEAWKTRTTRHKEQPKIKKKSSETVCCVKLKEDMRGKLTAWQQRQAAKVKSKEKLTKKSSLTSCFSCYSADMSKRKIVKPAKNVEKIKNPFETLRAFCKRAKYVRPKPKSIPEKPATPAKDTSPKRKETTKQTSPKRNEPIQTKTKKEVPEKSSQTSFRTCWDWFDDTADREPAPVRRKMTEGDVPPKGKTSATSFWTCCSGLCLTRKFREQPYRKSKRNSKAEKQEEEHVEEEFIDKPANMSYCTALYQEFENLIMQQQLCPILLPETSFEKRIKGNSTKYDFNYCQQYLSKSSLGNTVKSSGQTKYKKQQALAAAQNDSKTAENNKQKSKIKDKYKDKENQKKIQQALGSSYNNRTLLQRKDRQQQSPRASSEKSTSNSEMQPTAYVPEYVLGKPPQLGVSLAHARYLPYNLIINSYGRKKCGRQFSKNYIYGIGCQN